MAKFFEKIIEFWTSTKIPEQLTDVDIIGLFTNPWFLVPFIIGVGYMLYKQEFKNVILVAVVIAVWFASGTEYMNTLVVNGEIVARKVIPVVLVGAVGAGFLIYIFFGRSD